MSFKFLLKFNDLFEKVQGDFFEKNPGFYLSSADKEKKIRYKEYTQPKKELEFKLTKLDINDVTFKNDVDQFDKNKITNDVFIVASPSYIPSNKFKFVKDAKGDYAFYNYASESENTYKIIIPFINFINKKSLQLRNINKQSINKIFSILDDYYSVYFTEDEVDYMLYLTKNNKKFKQKIKKLRNDTDKYKIIYFNNKVKGKELIDYDEIAINKIKNKLKNITIDDITFEEFRNEEYHSKSVNVIIKDEELNAEVKKYGIISNSFFTQIKENKTYFGPLRNRFHSRSIKTKGIGLGYKIYKAFIKFQGYIVSDKQTSLEAQSVYRKLIQDEDLYHILEQHPIDNSYQKILLIWKDYKNIEKLLRIVKNYELKSGRNYEYDKRLTKYLELVKN